ncbi:MAG: hypothetical protein K0R78_974 [Pelosinus sp.]|jgi:hypothetical protein|nr:hypothetical protein [Pelosinus sp.]
MQTKRGKPANLVGFPVLLKVYVLKGRVVLSYFNCAKSSACYGIK